MAIVLPASAVGRQLSRAALVLLVACACLGAAAADAVRVKDLGKLKGWRDNALVGYGVVTGLAGTGDSPNSAAARQAMSNVFSRFSLSVPPSQLQSRNVAVVMISASLPPFAREGDALDVTVTSAGDSRSLLGGSLLLAPLKGADGRTYALAEGPLSVGGYRYDANGNVVQKNHPTVGSVPNGAKVEVGTHAEVMAADQTITFVLTEPDYTTATRIADGINAKFGTPIAQARDAAGVEIKVPESHRSQLSAFITRVESLYVEPDRRAKVVINERTGIVVSGGDVSISRVAISHGDLKITVATRHAVSQPSGLWAPGQGIRTEVVSNSNLDVSERDGPGYIPPGSNTVAALVQSLSRLKTNTRDVISILRAIKAAGALHGELVIQ